MNKFLFLSLLWLFNSCSENNFSTLPFLKCANNSDKNEELRCHFYYAYRNLWDSLLVINGSEIEIYRLQYITHFNTPMYFVHSQVSVDKNETAKRYIFIFAKFESEEPKLTYSQSEVIDTDSFQKLIAKSSFWQVEAKCSFCDKVGDGDTYLLDGWKDGKHKVVHRDSPEFMLSHLRGKEYEELEKLIPLFREMKGSIDIENK